MTKYWVTIAAVLRYLQLIILSMYLVLCPFTKVEESFNIQAIHDLLMHGRNLSEYDHQEFPGVVPRTFIGPIVISVLAYPAKLLCYATGVQIIFLQYVARFILGYLVLCALWRFNDAVTRFTNLQTSAYTSLLFLTQFHFLFYATRPLPNIFALCLSTYALSFWTSNMQKPFIWTSAFVIIVFRSELAIFLGLCLLVSVIYQSLSLREIVFESIPAGIFSLLTTIVIDSWFWGRWLWPEGEVLFFNTVLNKSSQWGTLPFLWYFYSALPRLLLGSLIFIPWGIQSNPRRSTILLIPAIGFIFLYSFLPHKELRFIIYTVPLFNVVAAGALSNIHNRYGKDNIGTIAFLFMVATLFLNSLCCAFFLIPSYYNYPGGSALSKLHDMVPCDSGNIHVYIDNFVAQSGATRFGQLCPTWIYNKTENIPLDSKGIGMFTHALVEADDEYSIRYPGFSKIFEVPGIKLHLMSVPPYLAKVTKALVLRRNISSVDL